jgi:hypothetical protein
MKNGDIKEAKSSTMCFAWFVFEKGNEKDTIIKWVNNE